MRGKGAIIILIILLLALFYAWVNLRQMTGNPVTINDLIPVELQRFIGPEIQRIIINLFRKFSNYLYHLVYGNPASSNSFF